MCGPMTAACYLDVVGAVHNVPEDDGIACATFLWCCQGSTLLGRAWAPQIEQLQLRDQLLLCARATIAIVPPLMLHAHLYHSSYAGDLLPWPLTSSSELLLLASSASSASAARGTSSLRRASSSGGGASSSARSRFRCSKGTDGAGVETGCHGKHTTWGRVQDGREEGAAVLMQLAEHGHTHGGA